MDTNVHVVDYWDYIKTEKSENKIHLTKDIIEQMIKGREALSQVLLDNPIKLEDILKKIETKLKSLPFTETIISGIKQMISLIRAYVSKAYTKPGLGKILIMISAILYVLSPLDFIPDFIPGVGLSDDIAVIAYALEKVADELKDFKEWKEQNG